MRQGDDVVGHCFYFYRVGGQGCDELFVVTDGGCVVSVTGIMDYFVENSRIAKKDIDILRYLTIDVMKDRQNFFFYT